MKKIFISLFILGMTLSIIVQQNPGNNDKSKVLIYTLPDPMVFNEDSKVVTKKDCNKRRNEIYKMFSEDVYGIIPRWHGKSDVTPVSRKENILNGMNTREEVMLHIKNGNKQMNYQHRKG